MKRVEQLLAVDYNRERFQQLVFDIKRGKLVILFGAGLSLWREYSKWGYPFFWSLKENKKYYDDLTKFYDGSEMDSDTRETLDKIAGLLSNCEELLKSENSDNYLQAGNNLETIIKGLRRLFDKTPRKYPYKSFYDCCRKAFSETTKPPAFDPPYMTPALYYLPYLGKLLITTNVDCSFEKMCELSGNEIWCSRAIKPRDEQILSKWDMPPRAILYIHGHIKEPDSLVMTQDDYSEMYPETCPVDETEKGSRAILKKVAEEYSILFLGTSLQTDATVKIFNHELDSERIQNKRSEEQLRFITISQLKENDRDLVQPPLISDYEPLTYGNKQYQEIASYLLQLIRLTANDSEDSCCWMEPDDSSSDISIPAEILVRIQESLKDNKTFDVINLSDCLGQEKEEIIHYLYEHYSVEKHDTEAGDGWSICCINSNAFSLDGKCTGKGYNPLHNYPLGDTIYVLRGGRLLYQDEEREIVSEIEKWLKGLKEYQEKRTADPVGNGVILPRVRVIVIPPDFAVIQKEDVSKIAEKIVKLVSSGESKELVHALGAQLLRALNSSFYGINTKKEDEQTQDESKEHAIIRVLSPTRRT